MSYAGARLSFSAFQCSEMTSPGGTFQSLLRSQGYHRLKGFSLAFSRSISTSTDRRVLPKIFKIKLAHLVTASGSWGRVKNCDTSQQNLLFLFLIVALCILCLKLNFFIWLLLLNVFPFISLGSWGRWHRFISPFFLRGLCHGLNCIPCRKISLSPNPQYRWII